MRPCRILLASIMQIAILPATLHARINTIVVHNANNISDSRLNLKFIPAPSSDDAATRATFSIVEGRRDDNGGDVIKLHDGKVPTRADQPSENFFFAAG